MSTIQVNEILSRDGTKTLMKLDSGAMSGVNFGRRNLIINGGFDVWQRGTTSTTYGYIADRFRMSVYSGTVTHSRVTSGLDNHYYAYRITNVSGTIEIEQRLEGTDIPNNADEMTISFWVRGSKSGSFRTGRITNASTASENSGYGYVNVTTSWNRISITTTNCPSADPSQYYRVFVADTLTSYFSSTSDWLEITGVQLEVGSVATPFEHRSYGEELALCQRYYEVIYSDGNGETIFSFDYNGSQNRIHWFYKVEKRAAPSFGLASGGSFDNSYTSIGSSVSRTQVYHSSPTFLKSSAGTISAYVDAEL